MCPTHNHFVLITLLKCLTFVLSLSLSGPDVGPSDLACDVEHTSFHLGLWQIPVEISVEELKI